MPGLVGHVSSSSHAEQRLDQMVALLAREANYQIERATTPFGQFALVHLGLFGHTVRASALDGQVGLLLDGWIWDYPTAWRDAKMEASDLASICLEGYLRHGKGFVRELNGEFNLLIWDYRHREVYLLTDRYGLRPLQYAVLDDTLVFAPEGKAVVAGVGRAPKLDRRTVQNWLSLGRALFEGRTFFDGVRSLPLASIVHWQNGRTSFEQYWDFAYRPVAEVDDDFVDHLARTFRRAVEKRVRPGIRYGLTLSGGLDSRMMASMLGPATDSKAIACTFGAAEGEDVVLAKQVASQLGIEWKCIELTAADYIRHAAEGIRLTEGMDLFVQSYALEVYPKLHKLADVLLTGLALDVTLGGSYLDEKLLEPETNATRARQLVAKKLTYFDHETVSRLFNSEEVANAADEMLAAAWRPEEFSTNWGDHADRFVLMYRGNRMLFWRQGWQRLFVEDVSPTFDNDVVDLLLQIPTQHRLNHRFYLRLMRRIFDVLMVLLFNSLILCV
jgi:asparagine synthase (glutamine-hydrolysing)